MPPAPLAIKLHLPLCLLAGLVLATNSVAQTTYLVGTGPDADFLTVDDGVLAAADGDVLLLLAGAEAGSGALSIVGKGLTIAAPERLELCLVQGGSSLGAT